MKLIFKNYCWVTLWGSFVAFSVFTKYSFLLKCIFSISIYAACGGWRFIRILILTGPRDLIALKALISVHYQVWQLSRNHYTVPDLFEKLVQRRGLCRAFVFDNESTNTQEIWTFNEVDQLANKLANYLLGQAIVKPGDVVGLFMENRPCYVAIWMGLSKIGAVPALINFNLRQNTLVHCLTDANCRGIICGVELAEAFQEIKPTVESNLNFTLFIDGSKNIINNNETNKISTVISQDHLIAQQSYVRPSPSIRRLSRKPYDALLYIYTSGTTGLPKAAKIAHTRYLMMSYGVWYMLKIRQSDVIYNSLPLYHTAGGMIGVGQVILGGSCMALRKKFSASNFWTDCVKYNATVMQYIGEVCRYLLVQPGRPQETQHTVRVAFGNGIRPQIWQQFQDRFKIKLIGEFYGATESNANMCNNMNKVGAVGFSTRIAPFIYPITLIKVDSETGEPLRDARSGLCIQCEPNETGELVGKIRDRDITGRFDGYVNSKATNKKIICDVFHRGDRAFVTGDLLVQDELGYFYFKDRVGDTFRWKGENVSTAEVEAIVSNVLQLNDCVVYGVEIPNCEGRAGMAAIVDTEGAQINSIIDRIETTFYAELGRSLPPYARPLFIRLCSSIEMTGTFKMKKINLVQDGYNPSQVQDRLFYLNGGKYQPLNKDIYQKIINVSIKF